MAEYYRYHMFFCTNVRQDGSQSCGQCDASGLRDYAKQKIKQLGLAGQGGVRVNQAGCLDRCSEGPVMVIYPDAVWYTLVDEEDVDEIIEKHIQGQDVVARLQI